MLGTPEEQIELLEERAQQIKARLRTIRRDEFPRDESPQSVLKRKQLKSEARALREQLVDVRTRQARLLGIQVNTQPRRQSDQRSSRTESPHGKARTAA